MIIISMLLRRIAFKLVDFKKYPEILELYNKFLSSSITHSDEKEPTAWFKTENSQPLTLTQSGTDAFDEKFQNFPEIKSGIRSGFEKHGMSLSVLYSVGHTLTNIASSAEYIEVSLPKTPEADKVRSLIQSLYSTWGGYAKMGELNMATRFKGKSHKEAIDSLEPLISKSIPVVEKIAGSLDKFNL